MLRAILLAAACLTGTGLYAQFGSENYLFDGVPPSTSTVQQGATQHNSLHFLLGRFDTNSDTFAGLTVRNNGTAQASDIAQIQLWWDANDSDTFEPSGADVLVASASGGAFPIGLSSFTSQNHLGLSGYGYFVSIDVAAGAVPGRTFILEVTTSDVFMLTYPVIYYASAFSGPTQTVTSTPGPNQIVMTTQPGGALAGTAFTTQPVLELRSSSGALLNGDNTTVVTAAITGGTGTSGAVLGGTVTDQASGGVIQFSNLAIDLAGTGYTLTFTATSFTSAVSAPFNVTTGQTATQLVITTQPGGAQPGSVFTTQPVVQIRDGTGALVLGASNFVGVTLNGGTGGTLSGTLIVQAVNGTATFSNLSINNPGGGYSLTFSATGLTSATSNSFNVGSGNNTGGDGSGGGGGGCAAHTGAGWLWLLALAGLGVLRISPPRKWRVEYQRACAKIRTHQHDTPPLPRRA